MPEQSSALLFGLGAIIAVAVLVLLRGRWLGVRR